MSTLRDAVQQAILLCRWIDETPHQRGSINGKAAQVQHALEQALAEPEQPVGINGLTEAETNESASVLGLVGKSVQQPVAWRVQRSDGQYELYFLKAAAERAAAGYIKRPPVEPLYTAPTPRKPLTEEERVDLVTSWGFPKYSAGYYDAIGVTHSVEAAHGIGEQT